MKFDVVVTDTGPQMIKRKLIKKQGYLSVNSISQFHDANVYVDGEYVDVVPLSNYLLPVGFHKIVVKKKGFFSFNETVRISDDKTTSLNVKLNSNKWVKQAAVGAGAIILYNILNR